MYKSERKKLIEDLKNRILFKREDIKRERSSMKGASNKDSYKRRIESRKGEIERLKNQLKVHRENLKSDKKG
jgi:hypothetical protein